MRNSISSQPIEKKSILTCNSGWDDVGGSRAHADAKARNAFFASNGNSEPSQFNCFLIRRSQLQILFLHEWYELVEIL
jgi:hypothetical protein